MRIRFVAAALALLLVGGMAKAQRLESRTDTRQYSYRLYTLSNLAGDRFAIACDEIE